MHQEVNRRAMATDPQGAMRDYKSIYYISIFVAKADGGGSYVEIYDMTAGMNRVREEKRK